MTDTAGPTPPPDADYDPLAPPADPWPALAEIAEECPVAHMPSGLVLVTTRDRVRRVFRDDTTFSSRPIRPVPEDEVQHIVHLDGAEHVRIRRLISQAFTEKSVVDSEPRIREITGELLDGFAGRGSADLVAELTAPMPAIVFSEILGIPPEDREQYLEWADDAIANNDKEGGATTDAEFREYILSRISEYRARQGPGLISSLVHTEVDQDSLSDPELVAMVRILIIAGTETTANLMATMFHQVLREPGLAERIRGDRDLLPRVVEESLRIDPPLNWVPRVAAIDTEFDGVAIPEGGVVAACVGHANHDRSEISHPETFDVDRPDEELLHFTFGHGVHFCVGAPLARLEARIALEMTLDRFSDLRIADSYEFAPRGPMMMRGCADLPVVFTPEN
ncbi:MAG: cytochrome P450 [Acidimicrobiia bacterium]